MMKPLVLVMCSSGIRLGAWDYLKWKHVIPKYNDKGDEIMAAKLVVYAGEPQQYFSFITSEAYNALKEWMDYRRSKGENITGESWILINKKVGHATFPKKLSYGGVKRLLSRTLKDQGLRGNLPKGQRRYEWKAAHRYRKFFKTHAENAMKGLNVELLMGHNIGLNGSYYKPTERELFEEYLKAVPALTINYDMDKSVLQEKVSKLEEKNEVQDYFIKGKLAEKEKEAEETKKTLADFEKRQRQFEEQILSNLEKYQMKILEMVEPYSEEKISGVGGRIKDKRELNREKIKALVHAPSGFGLIKEEYLDENQDEEEKEG